MREFAAIVLGGCVTALHASAPTSEAAQPFALPAQDGTTVALDRTPTVLVFYRGHW